MARKNGLSIDDPNTLVIIKKYLAGGKLTPTEKATIAGLISKYPSLFTSGTAQWMAGVGASSGNVNVNLSNVQTNPYAARSAYNQKRSGTGRSGGSSSSSAGDVTSPGGFKSSGRDLESQMRRSGQMTPDAVISNIAFDGDNMIVGKRVYNKAQRDAILQRGMSGATMNWADQAVYDALVRSRESARRQAAERKADAEAKRLALNERLANVVLSPDVFNGDIRELERLENEKKRRTEMEKATLENDAKFDLWRRQEDYRNRAAADAKRAEDFNKRLTEHDERIAFNRRYGIPDDVSLTNEERKSVIDGKSYWGLSKKDREQSRKIDDEIDRIVSDPATDLNDVEGLYRQRDALKSRFVNRLRDKEDEDMTPQQSVDRNLVVVTDPESGRKVSGIWKDGAFTKVDFGKADGEERWNGLTVKDFINAVPRKRTEKDENGVEAELDVPLEDRISEGMRAWNNRESLVDPNAGAPVIVSPFDPINPNNPATNLQLAPQAAQPVEQPIVPQAAPTGSGTAFADFFRKGARPQNEAADDQGAEVVTDNVSVCPVCGANLDANGVCGVCGYPDEAAVARWREAHAE